MRYKVGVDMGGTNTDLGLVGEGGNIVERGRLATAGYRDFPRYVADMVATVRAMAQRRSEADGEEAVWDAVGIGAPDVDHTTGCIVDAPNLPMKGRLDFRTELGRHCDAVVAVDNDANAAAYGEYVYGGARGLRHFVMFTLGTGVGSGIVVDGRLLHGATGAAGELGHAILVPGGRQCGCGRRGCLEMYASARGIVQTYAELRRCAPASGQLLSAVPDGELDCRMVGDAAHGGEALALRAWAETAEWLGVAMANAVAFSSPEAVFLMGGPVQVGEPLLRPLREAFARNLLFLYRGSCDIRLSQLPANDVAVLGAAALTQQDRS